MTCCERFDNKRQMPAAKPVRKIRCFANIVACLPTRQITHQKFCRRQCSIGLVLGFFYKTDQINGAKKSDNRAHEKSCLVSEIVVTSLFDKRTTKISHRCPNNKTANRR